MNPPPRSMSTNDFMDASLNGITNVRKIVLKEFLNFFHVAKVENPFFIQLIDWMQNLFKKTFMQFKGIYLKTIFMSKGVLRTQNIL